jgi:MFS family permease
VDAPVSTAGTGTTQETGLAFFRPFLPLFGTIFFCLLSVGASLATLPFWVTDRLGGGNLAVGFVVATIAVAAIVARPVAGRLADRFGKLRVYRVVAPVSAALMLVVTNLPRVHLAAAVAAVGALMVSNAGRMIAAMAMVTGSVEPRLRRRLSTSSPPMRGRPRSRMSRSYSCEDSAVSASLPEATWSTA